MTPSNTKIRIGFNTYKKCDTCFLPIKNRSPQAIYCKDCAEVARERSNQRYWAKKKYCDLCGCNGYSELEHRHRSARERMKIKWRKKK